MVADEDGHVCRGTLRGDGYAGHLFYDPLGQVSQVCYGSVVLENKLKLFVSLF